MTYQELQAAVALHAGITGVQAKAALHAVRVVVAQALVAGQSVNYEGLALIESAERTARVIKSVRTRALVQVPKRKVPRFVPSTALKKKLR
jgi:nucleoid DNA-binding protein